MLKPILKNPEIKSFFRGFLILYLLFASTLIAVLYFTGLQWERAMMQREVAVIGHLLADRPEDENHVIGAFFQERTAEDLNAGSKVVSRYGVEMGQESFRHSRQWPLYRQLGIVLALLLGCGLLSFLGMLFYFGRQMSGRFQGLARGAEEIMDGNFAYHLPEEGEGDLALVGFQFNQMARRLQLSMEALEREKGLLKDLISNISHQLKTPLASLRTYNELLLEGAVEEPEVREEFLQTSQHQIERMEWLVQTMLKISRLEAGVIPVQRTEAVLNATLEEVLAGLKLRWQAKSQTLSFTGKERVVNYAHDRQWLGEALENILKNAIDYTPRGGCIEVTLEETNSLVRIKVQDTGVGISEADLPHIFKQFYQGTNRGKGGSGVGLALARLVVEKHGGLIHVESSVNHGTTFTLTLPKWNL